MARDVLPRHIQEFLDTFIDSVEQLRVLLLLYSDPQKLWTVAEITAELRSAESSITKRLDDLYSRKVMVRLPELKGSHRFSPSTADIEVVVRDLAEQNQLRPYKVIDAIYSRPDKVLRDFADAFKFRGDKG